MIMKNSQLWQNVHGYITYTIDRERLSNLRRVGCVVVEERIGEVEADGSWTTLSAFAFADQSCRFGNLDERVEFVGLTR